jgi:hypothetical protein
VVYWGKLSGKKTKIYECPSFAAKQLRFLEIFLCKIMMIVF